MIDQKLVRNYASCLFDNIKSDSEHQKILEQISLFNQVLLSSETLRFALYSPVISKSDKLKLVKSFVEKFGFEKIVSQFFIVVVKNSRFEILSSVMVTGLKMLLTSFKDGVKMLVTKQLKNIIIPQLIKKMFLNLVTSLSVQAIAVVALLI